MAAEAVRGFTPPAPLVVPPSPYVSTRPEPMAAAAPPAPVFITARFRSGSTLLWQIFRQLPEATAFYEPHNGRRWFDTAQLDRQVDPSHRGVDNYWREYEGMAALARLRGLTSCRANNCSRISRKSGDIGAIRVCRSAPANRRQPAGSCGAAWTAWVRALSACSP